MSIKNKNDYIYQDIINWIQDFQKKYGRSPRILHIGNIANNAYNNVKLLRKIGLDCDVLCYNYYHIMSCPEWEDADFEGDYGDQFFPDWTKVDLKGFKRPDWFVQGPLELCIKYLIAKRRGNKFRQKIYWKLLSYFNRTKKMALFSVIKVFFYLKKILLLLKYKLNLNMKPKNSNLTNYDFDLVAKKLINAFCKAFPNRQDKLTYQDIISYKQMIPLWVELFKYYDLIQAYGIDPIYPMFAGVPYVAFEHGTLREIPFENTSRGRLTALSYHLANHVFVTNIDCLENAFEIIFDKQKISYINHPYDENHGLHIKNFKKLRDQLKSLLNADFLFFFPTRHDWTKKSLYSDKGNDIFIKAFCKLRKQGFKVGMVCCEWGYDVKESQKLLSKMECSKYVIWSPPMNIIKFERTAKACDIVVDQFKIGTFGGITFKSMAVGAPVCTYLNKEIIKKTYKELPPVINCKTEEEIVEKMIELIKNPYLLKEISIKSREWIEKYHNSFSTIAIQAMRYKKIIMKEKFDENIYN